MKRITLFMLIFAFTTLFSSCNKADKPDIIGEGVNVYFGEDQPWLAQKHIAQIINNKLYLYAFKETEVYKYPYIYLQIDLKENYFPIYENDFNSIINPNASNFIEYYEQSIVSDGVENHGDWWAKAGTINLTLIDTNHNQLSGEIIVDMFNAAERYGNKESNEYRVKRLYIALDKVPLVITSK